MVTTNQMEQKQKRTSLLDLPPEIWSKICKSLVTYRPPISVHIFRGRDEDGIASFNYWSFDGARAGVPKIVEPAIMRVCRSIRQACIATFYRTNIFVIHDNLQNGIGLAWWLDVIGPEARKNLQHLYFKDLESCLQVPLISSAGEWKAESGNAYEDDQDVLDRVNGLCFSNVMPYEDFLAIDRVNVRNL